MMVITLLLYALVFLLTTSFIALSTVLCLISQYVRLKKSKRQKMTDAIHVGIFHPYCNAGGGGERVLWCAVRTLQTKYPNVLITIYTGDMNATSESILKKARNTFNIILNDDTIDFVFLATRGAVEAKRYPVFTLLGQSLGSMILGLEALLFHNPDVLIDTMGYAFIYPIFRFIGGCKVGSYTHYPTISTDMLRRVQSRVYAHNNKSYVARNPFLTSIKLFYYKIFAFLYKWVGRSAHTVMVNSSWTENHILQLWNMPYKTHRVYPPCEVSHLKKLVHNEDPNGKIVIMSVGQFRPEKDHPLQLQAMYELRTLLRNNEQLWNKLKLVLVGSCRDDEDKERMQNMKDLAKHLSLEDYVEFQVNVSYQELLQLYQAAKIGIHTMWNEHFGISVVDCMAAGLIMIAHRSGGPLMDIIETSEGSQTGYLAVHAEDYAKCIAQILYNTKETNQTIIDAARSSVDRFSEKEFENTFHRAVKVLFE